MPDGGVKLVPVPMLSATSDPGTTMLPPGAVDAGRASSTTGGTVKLPSLARAVQVKPTVVVVAAVVPKAVLAPAMVT